MLTFRTIHVDIRGESVLFDCGEDLKLTQDELDFPHLYESELYVQKPLYIQTHPLQHDWKWDDTAMDTELYDLNLTDFGSGASPPDEIHGFRTYCLLI